MRTDYHMHTPLCGHATGAPRDYVLAAQTGGPGGDRLLRSQPDADAVRRLAHGAGPACRSTSRLIEEARREFPALPDPARARVRFHSRLRGPHPAPRRAGRLGLPHRLGPLRHAGLGHRQPEASQALDGAAGGGNLAGLFRRLHEDGRRAASSISWRIPTW